MTQILIVEDDGPFADALASALRLEGHEVLVADNANEGIQLGLAHCPDVVIADWMLKNGLHGGEVCRRIHAAYPIVKTIIMTGYPNVVSDVDLCCEITEGVIAKPFHKNVIVEVIDRALSDRAAFRSDQVASC